MRQKSSWGDRWKTGWDSPSVSGILSEGLVTITHSISERRKDTRKETDFRKQMFHFWTIRVYAGTDPFGQGTIKRWWDDGSETLENYKRRLEAAFEFFSKLGWLLCNGQLFDKHLSTAFALPIFIAFSSIQGWNIGHFTTVTYRQRVERWTKRIGISMRWRTLSWICKCKPESNCCGIPVISSLIRGLLNSRISYQRVAARLDPNRPYIVIPMERPPIRTRTSSHTLQLKSRKDWRSARSWAQTISSFGAVAKDTSNLANVSHLTSYIVHYV